MLNCIHYQSTSIKTELLKPATYKPTVSGGLTGGSLVNAQIAGVVGQNAAENNYLSDAQAAQEQKELKQCTNIGCTAKVKTQWAAINAAQQASFTAGIVVGLPAGAIEPIKELVHMATNPGETYEALKGLFTSGNILGNVSDAVKESYISRLDKLEEEYQRAGASGSYNAGIETGKLLLDMASLATGVGGAAKAGIKVTEKAIAKVANAAKKELIEAGKSITKPVTKAETGIEWGKGIQKQGMPWEDFVGKELPAGSRLPPNFKTFDYFDRATGKAVSVKTLDTTTPAKIANPKQIFNTLKNNIDAAARFEEHRLGTATVSSTDISSREIRLAVPAATNKVQWQQIHRAIDYGKSQGVKVIVTEVK